MQRNHSFAGILGHILVHSSTVCTASFLPQLSNAAACRGSSRIVVMAEDSMSGFERSSVAARCILKQIGPYDIDCVAARHSATD